MALMIPKNIHFPKPLFDDLKRLSEESGLPMAEIVRRAVDDYLEKRAPARMIHDESDPQKTR